jgi:ssDNA-binding Zn-finger/Zn-ribbon topoisomerase 1
MDYSAPAVIMGYDNPGDREVYDWQSGGIKQYLIQEKYNEGYGAVEESFISSSTCPECGHRRWEISSGSKGLISSCSNPDCPEYHPASQMTKDVRSAKTAFYGRNPLGKRY